MATSVRFEQVTAPEVPEPKGNIFSNCLKVGDRLVLAGMVASDDAGGVIGGDSTYEQARVCFAKIEKLVEAGGGSLADVAKLTIYLIDMADRPALGRARAEFFQGRMPASTLIGVSALAEPHYRVEIEAIAFLNDGE